MNHVCKSCSMCTRLGAKQLRPRSALLQVGGRGGGGEGGGGEGCSAHALAKSEI
jgi:hypothetical protein